MSFAMFGPLPRPQPNPISGLPTLEAAIRRLEATITTPASREMGATPHTPASTVAGATNAGGISSSLWLLVEYLPADIDPDARYYVRRVFERTLEAAESDLTLPPERRRLAPKPFLEQQRQLPCAKETAERFQQGQQGVDRLLRQVLWRAVDALEAAALLPPGEVYVSMLSEQCAQFERVYQALKRRAGRCFALAIFEGEVRLLRRHRGSAVAEHLLFN